MDSVQALVESGVVSSVSGPSASGSSSVSVSEFAGMVSREGVNAVEVSRAAAEGVCKLSESVCGVEVVGIPGRIAWV